MGAGCCRASSPCLLGLSLPLGLGRLLGVAMKRSHAEWHDRTCTRMQDTTRHANAPCKCTMQRTVHAKGRGRTAWSGSNRDRNPNPKHTVRGSSASASE